jgi:hypothetical protein
MRVIKKMGPPCPCPAKLWDFYNSQADADGNPTLGVGTVIECDCLTQYTLCDSQREGRVWIKRVLRDKLAMTALRD